LVPNSPFFVRASATTVALGEGSSTAPAPSAGGHSFIQRLVPDNQLKTPRQYSQLPSSLKKQQVDNFNSLLLVVLLSNVF